MALFKSFRGKLNFGNQAISRDKRFVLILFFIAGLFCIPVPLLGYFHYDSAAFFALQGAFVAIWFTARNDISFQELLWLGLTVFAAGIPLAIADLIRGWFTVDGLAYWLFIPAWSVFLSASVTRFIKQFTRFAGLFSILIIISVATLIPLAELLTQPKVYFFNPVWGYFPGPIYDETLLFDQRLLFYRLGTLGWIGFLWMLPSLNRSRTHFLISIFSAILAVTVWLFYGVLGITRSEEALQQKLNSEFESQYLTIHFNPRFTDSLDVEMYGRWADTYVDWNKMKMDVEISERIHWYLYPDPWMKKELVGAKYTQYVPVWLKSDQIHVDETSVVRALEHEFIHVLAKQWTDNLLGASWSIGLTEGLAKALETDWESNYTNSELVAAREEKPGLEEIQNLLSIWGFYRLNSGAAYTSAGAYVEFLFETGREEEIRKAYANSSTEKIINEEFQSGWSAYLSNQTVDSSTQIAARAVFSGLSIFEKSAPRVATAFEQLLDDVRRLLTRDQREVAIELLSKNRLNKQFSTSQKNYLTSILMNMYLGRQQPERAIEISGESEYRNHEFLRADALILTGDTTSAKALYQEIKNQATGKDSLAIVEEVEKREHLYDRKAYLSANFGYWENADLAFENYPWLTLQTAINQKDDKRVLSQLEIMMNQDDLKMPSRFSIYTVITYLIKEGEEEIAYAFFEKYGSEIQNDARRKVVYFLKNDSH